jgi:hypothetical protein
MLRLAWTLSVPPLTQVQSTGDDGDDDSAIFSKPFKAVEKPKAKKKSVAIAETVDERMDML